MSLHDLYEECRSYRKFKQIEIPQDVFDSIFANVRITHSGNNRQQLFYTAVVSREYKDQIATLVHYAAALPKEIGEPKENEKAMAYIVIQRPEPAGVTTIDLGIAAQVICSSAWEKGVGSCMMLNFDADKVNQILHIKEGYTAGMIIALGYPSHTSTVVAGDKEHLKYYTDELLNYYVPKLPVEDFSEYL